MPAFSLPIQLRWSDIDANFHLRHSVYYDWGAMCRLAFLEQYGLTMGVMQEKNFAPIIFREECIFRREIVMGDAVTINLELVKARRDYSRWTIQHQVMKDADTVAAILTVDGAWIDTSLRKLALPIEKGVEVFSHMPLGKDFQWTD